MGLKGLAITFLAGPTPQSEHNRAISADLRRRAGFMDDATPPDEANRQLREAAGLSYEPTPGASTGSVYQSPPIHPDANDILRARIYGGTPQEWANRRSQNWR